MKDGYSGGDKDAIFQSTANQVCVRTNQAMRTDFSVMGVGTADDGVFHDNAVGAQLKSFALGYDAGAEHEAATGRNSHVAADCGVWCNIS